jgi:hypothetical protein
MLSNILLNISDPNLTAGMFGGLAGLFAGLFVVALIVSIALYVYIALAWQTIGRKLGYENSWIAWIPIVQLALIPILAEKEWPWVFILLVPIVNLVFIIIWTWKIFERRNYPGWLSLLPILSIIPLLNIIVSIGYLVLIGLVAWKDI